MWHTKYIEKILSTIVFTKTLSKTFLILTGMFCKFYIITYALILILIVHHINNINNTQLKYLREKRNTYDSPASARSSALSRSASTMASLRAT